MGYNNNTVKILGNCVTVARQTLTLFVGVRIPIPQPDESLDTQFVFGVFSLSKFGTRIGAAAFLLPADTSERDNRSDF